MAVNEKHVLDLSGAQLKKLDKRDGVGIKHLILDNNDLTKLDHLDSFPDIEKLSACGNTVVRMYGVSKCRHLIHLNLSNNNVICIEGLKDITNLNILNLSVNNIKCIQNLQPCENLTHLDLSKNNITALAAISHLAKLKNLHLNGNKVASLTHASTYLPSSLCVLALADNCIADLNEVSHFVGLHSLEQLTISGNPCVIPSDELPFFDYRPFVINWCLGLRLLDGYVATQKESLKAEWLYSQGKGRHFKSGEHIQLVEYLAQVCPLNSDQLVEEEDEKLSRILQMQRQHKEQFLNELSQVFQPEQQDAKPETTSNIAQSFHSKSDNLEAPIETKVPDIPNISSKPSRIMYESAPEVLFHYNTIEPPRTTLPSIQSENCPRSLSKSEILHNSARSPITIEQVTVDIDTTKAKPKDIAKSPYQYYDDRRVRPSSTGDVNQSNLPKGTLVRKVSKRATSPCMSSPGRSKLTHSASVRSKLSPSRSCILSAKFATNKNSSESDTSEEHGQTCKGAQRNIKAALNSTYSRNSSPVSRQKFPAESSPMKLTTSMVSSTVNVPVAIPSLSAQITQKADPFQSRIPKPHQLFLEKYGCTEEDLCKAVTKIQSVWRGYYVRHYNRQVCRLRQEIRFRRMEDHIQHLHGHMCRLTDFVLRQQKDLQHERELRKLQAEDIRSLHEKARELQKDVSVILVKAKQNELQRLSEHDSFDLQNFACNKNCISKGNKLRSGSKNERALQDPSPDSPLSSLHYSTQTFQENSGLFSPSSQTSSVTSGSEATFIRAKSRRELQPSVSDLSDADSGLQSMVSPNLSSFVEIERTLSVGENVNTVDLVNSFPNYRGGLSGQIVSDNFQDNNYAPTSDLNENSTHLPQSVRHTQYEKSIDPHVIASEQNKLIFNQDRNNSCNAGHYYPNAAVSVSGNVNTKSTHQSNIPNSYRNSTEIRKPSLLHKIASDSELLQSTYNRPGNGTDPGQQDLHALAALKSDGNLASPYVFSSLHRQSDAFGNACVIPAENSNRQSNTKCFQNGLESERSPSSDSVQFRENSCTDLLSNCPAQNNDSRNPSEMYLTKDGQSCRPVSSCAIPCDETAVQPFCKRDSFPESDKCETFCNTQVYPLALPKSVALGNLSKSSTPLEDVNSPQSPCTVEMSGRISHSCSFQSDGFTAAEELSATTTVKLFSARAMSMACGNSPPSPQSSIPRPISFNDPSSQASIRSPLVLAASMWEKKVQDIESTFHQLQSQIRDLEGAFGQIGQFGQFFYPNMLQDDLKETRHVIQRVEPASGTLVLDMPKINFKRTDNGSNDFLLHTHFTHQMGCAVPFLAPSNLQQHRLTQSADNSRVEELDKETEKLLDKTKNLKLPLRDTNNSSAQNN